MFVALTAIALAAMWASGPWSPPPRRPNGRSRGFALDIWLLEVWAAWADGHRRVEQVSEQPLF